jgi:hypothetical protein
MDNGSVLVFNYHQLITCETILPHFHDKQQWLSFGFKLSQEATFVAMEVLVNVD